MTQEKAVHTKQEQAEALEPDEPQAQVGGAPAAAVSAVHSPSGEESPAAVPEGKDEGTKPKGKKAKKMARPGGKKKMAKKNGGAKKKGKGKKKAKGKKKGKKK
jgi:hypothetical protein